jgi:transposase
MDKLSKIHVGLDVHKDSITVAQAQPGREQARLVGKVLHDIPKLSKLLTKLGSPEQLHLVYEAGPTGFALQRALTKRGYVCDVIAPSKIPKLPGERIKTDSRDAIELAQRSRSGDLRAIWIPDPGDEAIRDLVRAREDAVNARTKARQQLSAFLLLHSQAYPGKTKWCGVHARWLAEVSFETPSSQTAFTEYWLAVKAGDERVERLTTAVLSAITGWRFEPVVNALQAMRGIAAITAIGVVAEVGDFERFATAPQFMGYLGLVPSENSSGERTRRGSITKTGNSHVRRMLTEAAWNYRFAARINKDILARQKDASEPVQAVAWKAQLRLTRRFAVLQGRGVQKNKVCVAVARELAGFIWAIARQAQREPHPKVN